MSGRFLSKALFFQYVFFPCIYTWQWSTDLHKTFCSAMTPFLQLFKFYKMVHVPLFDLLHKTQYVNAANTVILKNRKFHILREMLTSSPRLDFGLNGRFHPTLHLLTALLRLFSTTCAESSTLNKIKPYR